MERNIKILIITVILALAAAVLGVLYTLNRQKSAEKPKSYLPKTEEESIQEEIVKNLSVPANENSDELPSANQEILDSLSVPAGKTTPEPIAEDILKSLSVPSN